MKKKAERCVCPRCTRVHKLKEPLDTIGRARHAAQVRWEKARKVKEEK